MQQNRRACAAHLEEVPDGADLAIQIVLLRVLQLQSTGCAPFVARGRTAANMAAEGLAERQLRGGERAPFSRS